MSQKAVSQATGVPARLEVEVKFLVDDLDTIRVRLRECGAELAQPRTYERNVRFDTPDEALLAQEQLLRLREDTRVRLTFKGRSDADQTSEAKIREEIEVTVDQFDEMALILERLGFVPVQIYEKYRETYEWEGVEIVLDEMPFGNFVELEGAELAIRDTAHALGLDWSRRVLVNYLAMMAYFRQVYDLPFSDVTFDNFRQHPISAAVIYAYEGPDAT